MSRHYIEQLKTKFIYIFLNNSKIIAYFYSGPVIRVLRGGFLGRPHCVYLFTRLFDIHVTHYDLVSSLYHPIPSVLLYVWLILRFPLITISPIGTEYVRVASLENDVLI